MTTKMIVNRWEVMKVHVRVNLVKMTSGSQSCWHRGTSSEKPPSSSTPAAVRLDRGAARAGVPKHRGVVVGEGLGGLISW
jgi:hypothetical protein